MLAPHIPRAARESPLWRAAASSFRGGAPFLFRRATRWRDRQNLTLTEIGWAVVKSESR